MKKILLIDDEDLVLRSVTKLLAKGGYFVCSCHSGAEALEKVRTDDFDLVISDIRMPNLSGLDIIKKMRQIIKEGKRRPMKEILITGYAEEEANKEAELLGVAEYIYKPFDVRDFMACVKKNIG